MSKANQWIWYLVIWIFEGFRCKKFCSCIVLSHKNVFYMGHIPKKGTICYLNCAIKALKIYDNPFVIAIFKTLETVDFKRLMSPSTFISHRFHLIYTRKSSHNILISQIIKGTVGDQ